MRRIAVLLTALMAVLTMSVAGAQDFKGKPIRIVAGASAGGPTDIVARLVGSNISETLGTPVVVENITGSLFQTAARAVSSAESDGHTMMMITTSVSVAQAMHAKISYDLTKDFEAVTMVSTGPLVLAARPGINVKSVADLVALAKKQPGKLSFGSGGGTGSAFYLSTELLKGKSGIDFAHIPYQGGAPALKDLLGGHIDLMFEPLPGMLGHIRDGSVIALAVTSRERTPVLPNVPTMIESGFPDFDIGNWFGLIVPAGTPADRVAKLQNEVAKAIAKPEVAEALRKLGTEPQGTKPAEFSAFLKGEIKRWNDVIKERGIKPN